MSNIPYHEHTFVIPTATTEEIAAGIVSDKAVTPDQLLPVLESLDFSEAMAKLVYDPNNVAGDVFDMDNMVEGATNLILTADERAAIAALASTYQPLDANLTSWAAITRASGFDTFAATPSSANLRALLSDEVGTGAAYFVGGALGTPASATLSNATGLPLSGLTGGSNDDIVQRKSGAWTNRTIAQLLTDLAAAGTTFQPLDADLTALAGLSSTGVPKRTASNTWDLNGLQETSTVIGSAAKHWNPNYFGNAATGEVSRLNRLLVGAATLASSNRPVTTSIWLNSEPFSSSLVDDSQLISVSAIGELGVVGASRTSDYRTWAGAASAGSQGVSGVAANDDTTGTPIAVGLFGAVAHHSGVSGISEAAELTAGNNGSVVDITPHGKIVSGTTMALNVTAGFTGYTNNLTVAVHIGSSVSAKFRKGIVVDYDGLDTSLGGGGGGIFAEVYRGQTVRWLNSSDGLDAEIWGDAAGFNVKGLLNVTLNSAAVTPTSGTTVQIVNADSSNTILELSGFGTNVSAGINGRSARGTGASPSNLQANDQLFAVAGLGYGGGFTTASKARMAFFAGENWDGTHQGTYIAFYATPLASTTRAEVSRIGPSGQPYFQLAATTASAANAFLDNSTTPANELKRSTSSGRFKKDIEDLSPDYAAKALQLRPVWYRSNIATDRQDWSWYGLIAEEVAAVDPRLVHWGYAEDAWETVVDEKEQSSTRVLKEGAKLVPDGVQYDRLVCHLLSLVQQADKRIATLEAKIGDLVHHA